MFLVYYVQKEGYMTKLQLRLTLAALWCIAAGLVLIAVTLRTVPLTIADYPMRYDRWTGKLLPLPIADETAEKAALGFERILKDLKITPTMVLPPSKDY
jgi:hypothetical protein